MTLVISGETGQPRSGSESLLQLVNGGDKERIAALPPYFSRRNSRSIDGEKVPAVGAHVWAIPEGYIPGESVSTDRALVSHEAACILNAGDKDADVTITIFFADREPIRSYRLTVGARRTRHLRFNDLSDPERIPRDTSYASLIESTQPIVVQHTRLDSRDPNIALLSTVAFACG